MFCNDYVASVEICKNKKAQLKYTEIMPNSWERNDIKSFSAELYTTAAMLWM